MCNPLGEKCPECGQDDWCVCDKTDYYVKICTKCAHTIEIKKQDFVDNFECPECGSLSGTLEENNNKLGVRCNNCKKLFIKLEKKNVTRRTYNNQPSKSSVTASQPHCPTCGSPNIEKISIGKKMKGSFFFGFMSKDVRSTFHCKNCGYKW